MFARRILVLAGMIAVAASCSGGSNVTGGGGGGGGGGGCSGTNAAPAVCDNRFSPAAITISAGSSVTWTWKGANAHNVTFTSGPVALGGSGTISSGSFTQTFTTPGTYEYECSIHVSTGMTGTITVN